MEVLNSFSAAGQASAPFTASGLEYVNCLLCGGVRHDAVLRGRDHDGSNAEFQVVRCAECGLHFTNPRPTVDDIGQYYGGSYMPHHRGERPNRPLRGWYPHDWLRMPARNDRRPQLLDFGCGAGHFLAAMQERGWDATGLDVSQMVVEHLISSRQLRALTGTLPHDSLEPGSFDLITMWHALEHVHDPLTILREARRLLAAGGRLVVAVPNFGGWARRYFAADWFGLELPRHITHFDADSLRKMLLRAGFPSAAIRHARHGDWVRASARRAPGGLLSSFLRRQKLAKATAWLRSRGSDGDSILACAA